MTEAEIEGLQAEVEQLRKERELMAGELAGKNSRLAELEQSATGRETELGNLKQTVDDLKARLGMVNENLGQAVASYRTLAAKANPETLVEMITGDTVDAIDKSVAIARMLVGRVKETLETKRTGSRIPAGAPVRGPADLSAMTAREKIQQGIKGK
jgi:chromosome segregation ATPase